MSDSLDVNMPSLRIGLNSAAVSTNNSGQHSSSSIAWSANGKLRNSRCVRAHLTAANKILVAISWILSVGCVDHSFNTTLTGDVIALGFISSSVAFNN